MKIFGDKSKAVLVSAEHQAEESLIPEVKIFGDKSKSFFVSTKQKVKEELIPKTKRFGKKLNTFISLQFILIIKFFSNTKQKAKIILVPLFKKLLNFKTAMVIAVLILGISFGPKIINEFETNNYMEKWNEITWPQWNDFTSIKWMKENFPKLSFFNSNNDSTISEGNDSIYPGLPGETVKLDYLGAVEAFKSGSFSESFPAFLRLAQQGNIDAQVYLGLSYLKGHGVPKNDKKAFSWYLSAAKKGNAYGQNAAAWMLQNGKGVKQNYREAIILYKKAATQGNHEARKNLISLERIIKKMQELL